MSFADLERPGRFIPTAETLRRQEEQRKLLDEGRWKRSEEILNILRIRDKASPPLPTPEAKARWWKRVSTFDDDSRLPESWSSGGNSRSTSCKWFEARFPEVARKYGHPFIETTYQSGEWNFQQTDHKPDMLNFAFFAAILGGDKGFGHDLIYDGANDIFYFYDPVCEAYRPTTLEKLEALLMYHFAECAKHVTMETEALALNVFPTSQAHLAKAVHVARSLFTVTSSFFHGPNAPRRWFEGKYLEARKPPPDAIVQFADSHLQASPGTVLSLPDSYTAYVAFCGAKDVPPKSRKAFRQGFDMLMRKKFTVGLRRDLKDERGKTIEGWNGVRLRLPGTEGGAESFEI